MATGEVPVRCPHCQAQHDLAAADLGGRAECESCGKSFTVARVDAAAGGPGTTLLDDVQRRWEDSFAAGAAPEASIKAARQDHVRPVAVEAPLPRALSVSGNAFVLLELLGAGGMGLVYRARQNSVDRQIAVKVIRPELADQQGLRDQFLIEAVVTGDLDHPNVIPIHDVGVAPDGTLFYAMKEVRGTPWSKAIASKSLEENLEILLKVADAVAYAHSKGVVHRDLKPENVMLGDYGEVLVMDWGLAISVSGAAKAERLPSQSGAAGTPAYLAPEMALGEGDRIGPASDIYLLGAILYESVTGLRPHAGKGAMACLLAAARNEIQPTDKKGELVRIALKAMATAPEDRYTDVKAFQQALRGYRRHAESIALATRAKELLARIQQDQASAAYGECNEAISGYRQALALWAGNVPAVKGLRRARETLAQRALERGDLALARSEVDAIRTECREFALEAADADLRRRSRFGVAHSAGAERDTALAGHDAAAGRSAPSESGVKPPHSKDRPVAISEDPGLAALAERVRAATEQAAQRERMGRLSRIAAMIAVAIVVVVSVTAYLVTKRQRDRAVVAEAAEAAQRRAAEASEKTAVAAKAQTEQALAETRRENYANVIALADRKIAAGEIVQAEEMLWTTPRELRGWEWGRCLFLCHQDLLTLKVNAYGIACVAFSPDGTRLVTADGSVPRVWDVTTGQECLSMAGKGGVICAAFSPDGRRIATGDYSASVVLWDATSGARLLTLSGHRTSVGAVAFAPDGTRVASAEMDETGQVKDGDVILWDAATGQRLATLQGHRASIRSVQFSPDGQRLVTASSGSDSTIRIWETQGGKELLSIGVPGALCAAFTSDGASVCYGAVQGVAGVWDAATGEKRVSFSGHTDQVFSVAMSADGVRAVTASFDRTARVWDVKTGNELLCIKVQAPVWSVALAPNGRLLATGGGDGAFRLWDAGRDGSAVGLAGLPGGFADGHSRLVTTGSGVLPIRTYSTETGLILREVGRVSADVSACAMSANGLRLVTGHEDGTMAIWDVPAGTKILDLEGHTEWVLSVAFSPDGARVVSSAGRLTTSGEAIAALVWDASSGQRLLALKGHEKMVWSARFSPDGRWIVTGSNDGTARIWDAASGQERSAFRSAAITGADPGAVTAVAFSPDGQWIVTGHWMKVAVIWDVASGQPLRVLNGHSNALTSVEFSPDGRRVFTAARDLSLRVWDAASGRELLACHYPGASEARLAGVSPDGRSLALTGRGTLVLNTLDWTLSREDIGPWKLKAYKAWLQENGPAPTP